MSMTITVIALLCQLTTLGTAGEHAPSGKAELCHEEIVVRGDSMQECMLFPANLAQWKEHAQGGRFATDDWRIAQVRCYPGNYEKKDEL